MGYRPLFFQDVARTFNPVRPGSSKEEYVQTAAKILVLGGLGNLAYGLFTGMVIGAIRAKQPTVSKYLSLAHQGPLMWAPILFGLVVVLPLSNLSEGLESLAAGAMVVASALLNTKDTWHWLRETKDEFAEKPAPLYLGHLMSLAYLVSLSIFGYGVLKGL